MTTALHRRALFAGASGLILAGCSNIIGPPPSPKLYVLAPALPHALPGEKVGWALSIQAPEANAGLDSDRIAVLMPPSGMDYYAGSAWAGRLPNLVQAALVEAFEGCGRIDAVARDSDAARSDYLLASELRDFEAKLDQGQGAPLAVVRIGARLVQSRSREIAGYTSVTHEVRAAANTVEAAVEALNGALAGVLSELVPWVLNRPAPG